MKKIAVFAALLSCLAAGAVHAEGLRVRPFVGFGLTAGGDNLATVEFTNGDSENLRAGGLVAFRGGIELGFTPTLSGQFSVGYHVNETNASNGDLRFSRFPLELLGHVNVNDSFRLGGGLRAALSPKVRGSGFLGNLNGDFDNAYGLVIEGEYFFTQGLALTVRYVAEKYKFSNQGYSGDVSGDHIGGFLNYYFN